MKLTHPDDPKQVVTVSHDHAAAYLASGWVEVAEPKKIEPSK